MPFIRDDESDHGVQYLVRPPPASTPPPIQRRMGAYRLAPALHEFPAGDWRNDRQEADALWGLSESGAMPGWFRGDIGGPLSRVQIEAALARGPWDGDFYGDEDQDEDGRGRRSRRQNGPLGDATRGWTAGLSFEDCMDNVWIQEFAELQPPIIRLFDILPPQEHELLIANCAIRTPLAHDVAAGRETPLLAILFAQLEGLEHEIGEPERIAGTLNCLIGLREYHDVVAVDLAEAREVRTRVLERYCNRAEIEEMWDENVPSEEIRDRMSEVDAEAFGMVRLMEMLAAFAVRWVGRLRVRTEGLMWVEVMLEEMTVEEREGWFEKGLDRMYAEGLEDESEESEEEDEDWGL